MARFPFSQDHACPARLFTVRRKPAENSRAKLIRLEFEVFTVQEPRMLISTGKVACRDLILGQGVDLLSDGGTMPYIHALRLRAPNKLDSWLRLEARHPWVSIVFGPIDKANDNRNSFAEIRLFDAAGYQIREYDYDLDKHWVRIGQAARSLRTSQSTVRRRVTVWQTTWGEDLVRRTPGGHRFLNIRLLRNLWNQD